MIITITVTSILVIALVAWLANRVLPFEVCPICAGVFLTWVGLLGAYFAGYPIPLTIPALLMGGSAVGSAYQLEKRSSRASPTTRMFFKVLFIPAGFIAAYAALEQWWTVLLSATAFLAVVAMWFVSSGRATSSHEETIGDIEKKMEDCC